MLKLNSNQKEIFSKAFSIFSLRIMAYGLGFVFTWIIANKFGAHSQGVFSIAFLFLSVGGMISKLGVDTSVIKWIVNATSLGSKKAIYLKSLQLIILTGILGALIVYFGASWIALAYNKPDVELSIKIAAIGIPLLAIIDVSGSYFRGEKKMKIFGFYFYMAKFLFPLLAIVIFYLYSHTSLEIPISSYVLGLAVIVILIVTHVLYIFRNEKKEIDNRLSIKFITLESYPMMISSSVVMIMGWSDVFLLGFFVPAYKIGVYSVAVKIATIVSFVYNAISTIAMPKIAEFYFKRDRKHLEETITYSSKIIFFFGTPGFLILFFFPEFFLSLFGEEYNIGTNVLRILLCAQFINILTGPVGPIFQMTGLQTKLQQYVTIALVLNIILSIVLVFPLGMEGVAIASAAGMVFWNIAGVIYLKKHRKLTTYYKFK